MRTTKTAVITGGAGGIGKVIAQTLAAEGWRVASLDVKYETVAESGAVAEFPGDVSRQNDLEKFAEFVARIFPDGTDLLVNNAMRSYGGIIGGCSFDDFDIALRTGVVAPYYLTKLLSPRFKPGASVINIASTRAFMSQADTESYSAAKGAICALTHSLAASLAERGIRVNAISPGWIDTSPAAAQTHEPADKAQHTSGRIGEPSDIARAVLFLADPRNSFINAQNLVVDGGMTRLMIYHNDRGWSYECPPPGTD